MHTHSALLTVVHAKLIFTISQEKQNTDRNML